MNRGKKSISMNLIGEIYEQKEVYTHSKQLGVLKIKAGPRLEGNLTFSTACLIFPFCFSVVKTELVGAKQILIQNLDTFNFQIIPKNCDIRIYGASSFNEFAILLISEDLLKKTSQQYKLPIQELKTCFHKQIVIKRNIWLNESLHRLLFEMTICKILHSPAIAFLEIEIIKEMFYLFRNPKFDCQVPNLNPLHLDHKSDITNKVLNQMEIDLYSPLNMKRLSKKIGASESSVLRYFTRDMKISPMRFLRHRRLEESYSLLKSGKLSVSDVSYKLGYSDVSSFISAFKLKFGTTPAKIKK